MSHFDQSFETATEFRRAVLAAVARMAEAGCRELLLCDDDFADWPLNDSSLIAELRRWAGPRRTLRIVARSFDAFVPRHPRWVAWRRQTPAVVECRAAEHLRWAGGPAMMVAPSLLALRVLDRRSLRGHVTTNIAEVRLAQEQFEAVTQHSIEAFPATTLGL